MRLARLGFDVTLIERETFPRHKLCGEFISPGCLRHFSDLGVLDEMLQSGGDRIVETRFYDRRGRSFDVPSGILDGGGFALSLSRAAMDERLLDGARREGARVLEGTAVTDVSVENRKIIGLTISSNGKVNQVDADVFVDATGRGSALSRLVAKKVSGSEEKPKPRKPLAVGFKAHFKNAEVARATCEIYSFPGGYGGLSSVEGGLANLCFLMHPKAAKKHGGHADELVRNAVRRNERANLTLRRAEPAGNWLAVSVSSFGKSEQPLAAENLFSVGDSAAFIDPFTGSGMLMALQSSALLADAVESNGASLEQIRHGYDDLRERTFSKRLRTCSLLRRIAFLPLLPTIAIASLNLSTRARDHIAGSTRSGKTQRAKIGLKG